MATKNKVARKPASPEKIIAEGDAARYAADRVWRHARSEFDASLDSVMPTIAVGCDLVYAVAANEFNDLLIATTREQAQAHYTALYKDYHVTNWQPYVEIRTPWYVFFNGVDTILHRNTGQTLQGESLVLFNLCEQEGILGEMAMARNPAAEHYERNPIQTGTANSAALNKVSNLALHERYLKAVRTADANAVLATMTDRPNIATRNYLANGQQDYIGLLSKEEITKYYGQLFRKYRIDSVDTIRTVIGDWFIFAELQWNVNDRKTGSLRSWHTVEFCPIEGKGLMKSRVGYGTPSVTRS